MNNIEKPGGQSAVTLFFSKKGPGAPINCTRSSGFPFSLAQNTTDAAVTAVSTAAGSATDSVVPARSCAGIMSPMTSKEMTSLLCCWDDYGMDGDVYHVGYHGKDRDPQLFAKVCDGNKLKQRKDLKF